MTIVEVLCYFKTMKKQAATARLEQKVKRLSSLIEVNALISSILKTTIQNLQEASANIKSMTSNKDEVAQTLKDLPVLLKKIDESADNLKALTEKSGKLVGDNKKNIDEMVEHFRDMGKNLKDASEEIKKAPWKLLRKP